MTSRFLCRLGVMVFLAFVVHCGRRDSGDVAQVAGMDDREEARASVSGQLKVKEWFKRMGLRPDWTSEIKRDNEGSMVRVGRITGDSTSEVIVAEVGTEVAATISQGDCSKTCSSLEPLDDQLVRVPFDKHSFASDGIPLMPPLGLTSEKLRAHTPCTGEAAQPVTAIILYSRLARNAAGGRDAIKALVYHAEAATNQMFANSGLSARLRVLAIKELAFTETKSFEQDLMTFREVASQARDDAGADVAMLLLYKGDDCGRAYNLSPDPSQLHDLAYGVVRLDCLKCGWSLTHELGHLLGACHDRNSKDKLVACPDTSTDPNYGYRNRVSGRRWGTVMARASEVFPRVPRWSNPDQRCGADPRGTPVNDNVAWMKQSAPLVAQFRCTK